MCMQRVIKNLFWMLLLAAGLQSSWAFSLLGPAPFGDDSWQQPIIGFNPLDNKAIYPPLINPLFTGPKDINNGYRRNVKVLYYACDPAFSTWFGSNGVVAVDQAFAILNSLTNVDKYSAGLTEFPLQAQGVNYQAFNLGMVDLKSDVLAMVLEQLGLADSLRYTWVLHNRFQPGGTTCPDSTLYTVVMRNFDITASPLNQVQYSPYVNGVLYDYLIQENCGGAGISPPDADATEVPLDPLAQNTPISSGVFFRDVGSSETFISTLGRYFTGLTRDDVAGLRWLMSTNKTVTESGPAGAQIESADLNAQQLLSTTNLFALSLLSQTTPPAALQALFPGLVISSVSNYFALVTTPTIISYQTNLPGAPFGTLENVVKVILTTNIQQFFSYTFANVVTQSFTTNTRAILQTIQVGPKNGSPVGSPFQTTVTTKNITITNVASGDYYLFPAGTCGFNFIQTLQTNVVAVTNNLISATNGGLSLTENLITFFTNHIYVVAPCTLIPVTNALYQGVGRIQFVRADFDNLLGQTWTPRTNTFTTYVVAGGRPVPQTLQRVVTVPDFTFSSQDIAAGPSAGPGFFPVSDATSPMVFDETHVNGGSAGPGVINSPTTFTLNQAGPIFENQGTAFLTGHNYFGLVTSNSPSSSFMWGSFDGTTNAPIVYPNGTSIANIQQEALVQIFPATLPNGTTTNFYSVTFTADGGGFAQPFTWTLDSHSPSLPPGLALSSDGILSGTPTQSGASSFVLQLTDSSPVPLVVNKVYTITIQ